MPKKSQLELSTDREVRAARPFGDRREYRIRGRRNLVLRITPDGTKTWSFLYRSPTANRRVRMAIGQYPEIGLAKAKDVAERLSIAVRDGVDPAAQKRHGLLAETFASLADRFISEHSQRNARGGRRSVSTTEAERILKANILADLGCHRAEQITREQIAAVLAKVRARGSLIMHDRTLGLLRSIYSWANATLQLDVNPTVALKKINAGRPRERVLDDDELRALWQRLGTPGRLSLEIRDALKLQLLLGVRIGEALGAACAEFELERQVWTIPAVRTKGNREHRLPLPPLALGIIRQALGRANGRLWLFASPAGDRPMRARSGSRAMMRIRDDIDLDDVGSHDLRRTLATGLGNMGIADETIERVLNHAPRTVAGKHYNHSRHLEPMRRALTAWEARLLEIVGATP